ncbi:MAG: hypothetical protein IPN61_02160 [Bacteroidetes bacterium]|nr:hypothetical protein [Bacteroidota bacterium]
MQLQWNYGASGLTSVTGLEVRVFAVEMVYVPEGDFNVAKGFYVAPSQCCGGGSMNGSFNAPGSNFPVINQRLTPSLTYSDGTSATLRIKGDAGVDTNNDGVIDNTTYPTGYRPFYCYKYELTEQQYADFLNTLTTAQISTLGIAGTSITLTNGQYFSSTPNKACGNSNATKLFAFADWSGLRPISILEFNKASYGPIQPILHNNPYNIFYAAWNSSEIPNNFGGGTSNLRDVGFSANSTTTRGQAGASYYGIMDLTGNATEPVVKMNDYSFSNVNGNGLLQPSGVTDISTWLTSNIIFIDQVGNVFGTTKQGFRSVRSAE